MKLPQLQSQTTPPQYQCLCKIHLKKKKKKKLSKIKDQKRSADG